MTPGSGGERESHYNIVRTKKAAYSARTSVGQLGNTYLTKRMDRHFWTEKPRNNKKNRDRPTARGSRSRGERGVEERLDLLLVLGLPREQAK